MIGERIKLQRQANRLSLQDFADLLEGHGISITKGALSSYENEKTVPGGEVLEAIRQILGVSQSFLERDREPMEIRYFLPLDLPAKRQLELDSYVEITLEKQIGINRIVGLRSAWKPPCRMTVASKEDLQRVSEFAEQVRRQWQLGVYPISSVTNLLEALQWDVYELPVAFGVPGAVGYDAVSSMPFLYYPIQAGIVNIRMRMLTLVAAAYLDAAEELRKEACRRFATTVLFSEEQARREFGDRRTAVSADELTMVKNRYGLPKYEIMSRLKELGIIDAQLYRNYRSNIRKEGYPSVRDTMAEPLFFYENAASYKMKVQYAFTEHLFSDKEAETALMQPRVHRG